MHEVEEKLSNCPQCQTDLTPYQMVGSMPSFCLQCKFPLMTVAGKYRLLRVVGQGAVGTVYLARHVKLRHNADRVVKVIKEEMLKTSTTVQRFMREVQVTAELSESNDHIVRIYDDFGELPHLGYFYVMEFIRGVSVRKYIQQQQFLPTLDWCVDIMGQLSDALHTAHMAGVIHRDLKPDNMMLTQKGAHSSYLKVLDWGIAKPLVEEIDVHLTQGLVGTPHYMAPEQAMNLEIDARTDVYAMAVIFYELLTGVNPFVAATGKKGQSHDSMVDLINAQLYKDPPSIREILPQRQDVTPALEAVIFKALQKRPDERFGSVMEFWEAIQGTTGLSSTTPTSHLTSSHPAMVPSVQITSVPTGQYTGRHIPPQSGQVNTGGSSQLLASAAREGGSLADQDSLQETMIYEEPRPTETRWGLFGGIALVTLLILGVGAWGWYQSRSQVRPDNANNNTVQARTPTSRPDTTSQRPEPPPRRIAVLTSLTPDAGDSNTRPGTNPPGNDTNPPGNDNNAQVQPRLAPSVVPARLTPRTIPPQVRKRRIRRRRWVRRKRRVRKRVQPRVIERRPVVRATSPCENGWRPIRIRPFLSSNAEVTAEGGRWKRVSSRLFCISPQTQRLSIVQEGYELCIFRVPRRANIRVRLLSAGSGGISASNCLRR